MALILVKYGPSHPVAKLKLETAKEEDRVLLIQNGVYWALEDPSKYTKARVYATKGDFVARGYGEEESKVPLLDYSEVVDLIVANEKFLG